MNKLPIDTAYLREQLERLLEIPSPTGFTGAVIAAVSTELQKLGLDVTVTRRGGVRAIRKGERRGDAVAIASHVDTLGAQVRKLLPNGRVALAPIATWSSRFAEGARATILSEKGRFRGTILPLKASGHRYNEEIDELPVSWDNVEMRVDALVHNEADLERVGIAIGDAVAIDPQPEFLDNGFIVSRHLDNKAGVAVTLAALKAMQDHELVTPTETHWLFTIEEEIGVGATSIVDDDVATLVAVDIGIVAPDQASDEFSVTVAMADQVGPYDAGLSAALATLCRENDIPFNKDMFRYYRSDIASAVRAGVDARTALITFGTDATHGYERTHIDSLRSLAELITAFCAKPQVAVK